MTSKSNHGGPRPGSGTAPRSRDGLAVRLNVRCPKRLLKRFERRAKSDGLSRSAALVAAIRAYLGEPDEPQHH